MLSSCSLPNRAQAPVAAAGRPAGRRAGPPAAAAGKGGGKAGGGGGLFGGKGLGGKRLGGSDTLDMDVIDARQQVDIERLINACHELQDKVEVMEAQLCQYEERGRDRAVALRSILRDDKLMGELLEQHHDEQLPTLGQDDKTEPWDSYRNSFTMLMSKGYIRTVETLRNRLMASEWELGLRPIALQRGVAKFERLCADERTGLSFDVISELYSDPTDLRAIEDEHLRMRARAVITETEAEERVRAFAACTAEAQKLAHQFSDAEFISKIIPDPIEHGMVDALRKVVAPMKQVLGGA